jgi:Protein of unknown function (DUF1579)
MYHCKCLKCFTAVLLCAAISLPSFAQDKAAPKKDEKQPSEAEMMAMMLELAKPGENHKLLASGVGTWTYTLKMWMDPNAAPSESSGTSVSKEVLGGRYFITEHAGKMQMPGPDGKMMDMDFKGIATEGYDNVKKKFVSSWIDNMGTGIVLSEGDYDAATKSLTYRSESEMIPGVKTKIREVIKINDKDHRTFEFYEDRGGTEVKTMEIKYTRKS